MEQLGKETPLPSQEYTLQPGNPHDARQDGADTVTARGHDRSMIPTLGSSLVTGGNGGSLTWASNETRERDSFRRMRSNIGHVAPNSPFVPTDMKSWLKHRVEMMENNIKSTDRAIALRRAEKASSCHVNIQSALDGRRFGDFRSTVLARSTIWRPDEVNYPSRPQAPWPDSSERKHEGYQRVRSGYSRFPPLPRVPGNPTVNWKQRSPVTPYDLDRVGLPVMQDAYSENDSNMESMIGTSLIQELDS